MAKSISVWFNSRCRLVQIILLSIPVVNWVFEIIVRWSSAIQTKKSLDIVVAIVVTFFGIIVGWIDAIGCMIFHHMFLHTDFILESRPSSNSGYSGTGCS